MLGLGLCLEVGAHVFFPRRSQPLFNDPNVFVRGRPYVEAHPTRGFALRPGFTNGEMHINAAGLRGKELTGTLDGYDIVLALGESSTFGWRVIDDQTYPAHLQREIDEMVVPRPVCVLNAGVPSYSSAQVERYLSELLPRYRPSLVVASCLWNDALFACLPNWIPDYLVQQSPRPWRKFMLRHSAVYRALAVRDDSAPSGPVHNPRALDFYRSNLIEIARHCNRGGAKLVFLAPSVDPGHVPQTGMKIGRRTIPKSDFLTLLDAFVASLHAAAAEVGVPVIEHRLDSRDPEFTTYFLDPVHLTGKGNEMLARDVADQIVAKGLLPGANRRVATSQPPPGD